MLDLLQNVWNNYRFETNMPSSFELAVERIAIVGRCDAGKWTLFANLMGWESQAAQRRFHNSMPESFTPETTQSVPEWHSRFSDDVSIQDYGLFCIIDVPSNDFAFALDNVLYRLEDSALIIYVIDGALGLTAEDYLWISRLRARKTALMVVLNKTDCLENVDKTKATLETQLALPVVPVSAINTIEVKTIFLERLIRACPQITTALGAQVPSVRRITAERMVRQTTILSFATSLEPIPLVDVSVDIGLQINLIHRLGRLYNVHMVGHNRWEIVATVAFGLLLRYFAQTVIKVLPYGGWFASACIAASGTWIVGQTAITYFDAQAAHESLSEHVLDQVRHALQRRTH